MTPITQPDSDEQRAKEREWRRQGMVPFCGAWTPEQLAAKGQFAERYTNEPTVEVVEIDWLEINREFS